MQRKRGKHSCLASKDNWKTEKYTSRSIYKTLYITSRRKRKESERMEHPSQPYFNGAGTRRIETLLSRYSPRWMLAAEYSRSPFPPRQYSFRGVDGTRYFDGPVSGTKRRFAAENVSFSLSHTHAHFTRSEFEGVSLEESSVLAPGATSQKYVCPKARSHPRRS